MKRSAREASDQASFEVNEDVLRALRLRRIVKESHGQALSGVAVNEAYPNLIATTGDVQSSVYDNEHFGDHLDLVSHYVHTSALTSCAWLGAADDALWAIGGADGAIQITSLALSCVIRVIAQAHKGPVQDVLWHASHADFVFSFGKDGVAGHRISSGTLAYSYEMAGISAACLDGSRLLLGTTTGGLVLLPLPALKDGEPAVKAPAGSGTTLAKRAHLSGASIDCVAFVEEDMVAVKAVNGRIEVFAVAAAADKASRARWTLKGSGNNACRFGLSAGGDYMAVGDSQGTVVVYSTRTGKEIVELKHKRSRTPIKQCFFTRGDRSVLFANGDATLWRYDYIDEATLAEWAKLRRA